MTLRNTTYAVPRLMGFVAALGVTVLFAYLVWRWRAEWYIQPIAIGYMIFRSTEVLLALRKTVWWVCIEASGVTARFTLSTVRWTWPEIADIRLDTLTSQLTLSVPFLRYKALRIRPATATRSWLLCHRGEWRRWRRCLQRSRPDGRACGACHSGTCGKTVERRRAGESNRLGRKTRHATTLIRSYSPNVL